MIPEPTRHTTNAWHFTDMSLDVPVCGKSEGREAVITSCDIFLRMFSDDEDGPHIEYCFRGRPCNIDGSIDQRSRTGRIALYGIQLAEFQLKMAQELPKNDLVALAILHDAEKNLQWLKEEEEREIAELVAAAVEAKEAAS